MDTTAVFDTLKNGVISLAQATFKNYVNEAQSDGQAMLDQMKTDIEDWTNQYTTGAISQDELSFIIQGRKEDLEVAALTQAGIAQAQLDGFKTGVINLVEKTIFSLV
jgi:hypothetical protein